jgi:hypothetical protein
MSKEQISSTHGVDFMMAMLRGLKEHCENRLTGGRVDPVTERKLAQVIEEVELFDDDFSEVYLQQVDVVEGLLEVFGPETGTEEVKETIRAIELAHELHCIQPTRCMGTLALGLLRANTVKFTGE